MSLNIKTDSGSIKVADVGGNAFSLSHQKANWIATSTNAFGVNVTGHLTLNKGQYMIIVQIPTSDSSSGGVTIWINDENLQLLTVSSSYNNSIFFLEVLEDNSIIGLKSQDSTRHNYSNLHRGFLQTIKLG